MRFSVILADRSDDKLHDPLELETIDEALAEELRSKGNERIPYTEFATETENAALNDEGHFPASPGPQA